MGANYILEQLGMPAEDAERIKEMCEDKEITVKQFMHQFLCDLVDNRYSGGSDERMLISSWFLRSQF